TFGLSQLGDNQQPGRAPNNSIGATVRSEHQKRLVQRQKLLTKAKAIQTTWRCQRYNTQRQAPLELTMKPTVELDAPPPGTALAPMTMTVELDESDLRAQIDTYTADLAARVKRQKEEAERQRRQAERERREQQERKKRTVRLTHTELACGSEGIAGRTTMQAAEANGSTTTAAAGANGAAPIKNPIQRYTEAVEQNVLDFNSWVQLLALVESEPTSSRQLVESTYDRFLAEFPLCFGYWNKYAQYELGLGKAVGTAEPVMDAEEAARRARAVYERGVIAVKHSVDIWVKYCEFLIQTMRVPADEARLALENALAACGSDPLAGPLWELYIQLETANNDMLRLNHVFKRIMYQPLTNLDEFWEKYNHFVLAQQLHTLATTEELNALAGEEEMDEGLLRVKIVNSVEAIKNKTAEGIAKRASFEAGIDRTYFHVTPVSADALKNWHAYLDYEEIAGDQQRCEVLYERCMIACANYEQLWVRYAQWKERVHGFEVAKAVFERAVGIFLKYRASIYLEYAVFLEAHKQIDDARQVYQNVLSSVAPKLVEAFVRCCNFERRQGNTEAVIAWYEKGMEALQQEPASFSVVAVSYATFVLRKLKDVARARSVFQQAVSKVSGALTLWLDFLQFEIAQGGDDMVKRVSNLYTDALKESNDLSNDEKNDLWYQYAEFMEDFADDVAEVRAIHDREVTWKRKNGVSRDRTLKILSFEAGSANGGSSVQPGSKRARTDSQDASTAKTAATSTPAPTDAAAAAAYAQYYQQAYQVNELWAMTVDDSYQKDEHCLIVYHCCRPVRLRCGGE
ncbi:TPA: hypothetical protein N0F65_012233, partial [Lagenidium giganteum]